MPPPNIPPELLSPGHKLPAGDSPELPIFIRDFTDHLATLRGDEKTTINHRLKHEDIEGIFHDLGVNIHDSSFPWVEFMANQWPPTSSDSLCETLKPTIFAGVLQVLAQKHSARQSLIDSTCSSHIQDLLGGVDAALRPNSLPHTLAPAFKHALFRQMATIPVYAASPFAPLPRAHDFAHYDTDHGWMIIEQPPHSSETQLALAKAYIKTLGGLGAEQLLTLPAVHLLGKISVRHIIGPAAMPSDNSLAILHERTLRVFMDAGQVSVAELSELFARGGDTVNFDYLRQAIQEHSGIDLLGDAMQKFNADTDSPQTSKQPIAALQGRVAVRSWLAQEHSERWEAARSFL